MIPTVRIMRMTRWGMPAFRGLTRRAGKKRQKRLTGGASTSKILHGCPMFEEVGSFGNKVHEDKIPR